jgi:hypothetical protein
MKTRMFLISCIAATMLVMILSPAWAQGVPGNGPMPPMPLLDRPSGGPGPSMSPPEQSGPSPDGTITLDEFVAGWSKVIKDGFMRMDTNGDGVLSKDELAKCQSPGSRGNVQERGRFGPQGALGNGPMPPSGRFEGGPVPPMPPMPPMPLMPPPDRPYGGIEAQGRPQHPGPPCGLQEWDGQRPRPRGGFDGPREPRPEPFRGWNGPHVRGGFGEMPPQSEWSAVNPAPPEQPARLQCPDPDRLFSRMDANGDGMISREEFRNFGIRQLPPRPPMQEPPQGKCSGAPQLDPGAAGGAGFTPPERPGTPASQPPGQPGAPAPQPPQRPANGLQRPPEGPVPSPGPSGAG